MMNVLMKALGMMMMEVMTILVVMMTVVTVDEDEDDDADDDKEIDFCVPEPDGATVAERYSQEPDGKEQPAPEAAGSRWRAWLRRSLRRSPPPMLRLCLWMKMGRSMYNL